MNNKGNTIIMALVILTLIAILLPTTVRLFQKNTRDTVKINSEETGMEVVRSGIQKGLWRLTSEPGTLEAVYQGLTIPHYDGIYEHNDSIVNYTGVGWHMNSSGHYRILLASGPENRQVTITCVGAADKYEKWVTLKAVYEDVSMQNALYVEADPNLVDYSTQFPLSATGATGPEVHWGPLYSPRGINVFGYGPQYPRKFSGWRIKGRDNESPYVPNSDNEEYWAHFKTIPSVPEVDLEKMKQQAINSTAHMGGSTYVNQISSVVTNLVLTNSTTWFFEGDVTIPGPVFLNGIVIVKGNLTINTSGRAANPAGSMDNMPIPQNALKEYTKHFNQSGSYPASSGFQGNPNATTYSFPANTVGIKGFVYVGGKLEVLRGGYTSPFYIYGSMLVKKTADLGNDTTFRIYRGDYKSSELSWPLLTRPTLQMISEERQFSDTKPL